MARVDLDQAASLKAARRRGTEEVQKVLSQSIRGMRVLAPDGNHLHGSGRRVSGKKLKNSFTSSLVQFPLEVLGTVTNTVSYSAVMAEGSRPHVIRAKRKKFLVFHWERGIASPRLSRRANRKGLFFFKKVNHPGNRRRNGYMTTPLVQFGRRNNFKVTITRGRI